MNEEFIIPIEYKGELADYPARLLEQSFNVYKIIVNIGRRESGIIYFLFDYWRQIKDDERATEFAKQGVKLNGVNELYKKAFENFLKNED